MPRPSEKTIKRLFAVSRNICAFEGCRCTLVDIESGSNIGEICHIKGNKPGSARYDENQSEKDRHGFDNLIVLCNKDHKIVDDTPDMYTVEVLLKMKDRHEKAGQELSENDLRVGKFTSDYSKNYGTIATTQSGNITVINGITVLEARQIALDLFEANFYRLSERAGEIATTRAKAFLDNFINIIHSQNPNDLENLEDPDFQYALFNAEKAFARSGDIELGNLLTNLLIDRVKSNNNTIVSIVLNESIEVVPKLTPLHFDCLSLVLIVSQSNEYHKCLSDFVDFLKNSVLPFISGASLLESTFRHLEYVGCGILNSFSRSMENYLKTFYSSYLSEGISNEVVNELILHFPDLADSFSPYIYDNQLWQVCDSNHIYLSKRFEGYGISQKAQEKLLSIQKSYLMTDERVSEKLIELCPEFKNMISLWSNSSIGQLRLTSVGASIAISNLKRITGSEISLADYIAL
jgi:hypothetical protein